MKELVFIKEELFQCSWIGENYSYHLLLMFRTKLYKVNNELYNLMDIFDFELEAAGTVPGIEGYGVKDRVIDSVVSGVYRERE